jgi:N-acetylneuraminic acid mutarotase
VKLLFFFLMPITIMAASLEWRELPPLPQPLAGQFVGVIDGHLTVAGGSHWTGVPKPWNGGKKIWVDTVYTLAKGDRSWRLAGHLPQPMGYGVAISFAGSMLCIGGQSAGQTLGTVYLLTLKDDTIHIEKLPALPQPASNMAGALVGKTVFVAGGQADPGSLQALHTFWQFDLAQAHATWKTLAAWPGPGVVLPVAVAAKDAFYLLSGAELTGTAGPPVGRKFLNTAFRYTATEGWRSIASLPHAVEAGYAMANETGVYVLGGNNGELADREFELKDNHPGFSREVLRYSPNLDEWSLAGEMPISLVTSGIAEWSNGWVIAGGEDHPANRSARVIAVSPPRR